MKTDLATSIGVAVIGTIIAYFVCNYFIGNIEPKSITVLDSKVSTALSEPDPELFNYKALNPTVETYVGECVNIDENGNCLDEDTDVKNVPDSQTPTDPDNPRSQ